ncbi:TolC family protein [Pedobacter sp. HMF7647]|uniref:TolC family protein n=1 Tax=Hufsiella arboris TaxID=2695275 RepID=A0A7K1YEX3_9SPHI|nr:TolC family protein [Hufsiella arboris]MXV52549.1 TolC family protein [Hufsiella arboris]
MKFTRKALIVLIAVTPVLAKAQNNADSVLRSASLSQCINYALKNQPGVKQSLIDEEIGERDIKSALAGWFPQIRGEGNFTSYLKQPTSILNIGGTPQLFRQGLRNNSNFLLEADQSIFTNELLLASRGAKYTRTQNRQNTELNKINTVVDVSKAFYAILTSQEQIGILKEEIARLEKQLKDSYAQYQAGLVDKTDYKRATISLSNARSDLKRTNETIKGQYSYLKQLMGYPTENPIELSFNNTNMESQVLLDTMQTINYKNRVEYKQLETQKQLQSLNINYYKYGFLPNVSAFINYNWIYFDNKFSDIYNESYPSSQTGLKLTIPIFTGTRRYQNYRREQLVDKRLDLDIVDTKNAINTEYQNALAAYKSNLNEWKTQKENVELSKDVYNTIKLQYNEGIKTYLEVTTAETDLRSTELNYLNALYSLLSSKLDVQRALGNITVNP